jgi:anion-transporting  ArsA/GET3 family ATPase
MLSLKALFSKKLLVLTGKGGIGKSLVTAALGQVAAERGMRVLLVERSEQDQLAPIFGTAQVGHNEKLVYPNLSVINLDPTRCFEEYVVKQLGQKKLFEKVFSNTVVKTFLNTIPGLGEAMVLGRIFYTCELASPLLYDIVIFDAPASGHMHNLMTTPDAIINSGIGGPFVREVSRVREFLSQGEKVGTVMITVPEELVVSESMEFLPILEQESPIKILGVLINRSLTDIDSAEVKELQQFITDPKGHRIASFLCEKYEKGKRNQEILLECLHKIDERKGPGSYGMLPEFGTIIEPLPPGFGSKFFAFLEEP